MLILLSGPSAVGKTFFSMKLEERGVAKRLIAVTTREPRIDESAGFDYEFLSKRAFHDLIRTRALADWDYLLGNYYGYHRNLERYNSHSDHGIAVVVSRMAVRLSKRYEHTHSIFLNAPDSELATRISGRNFTQAGVNEREHQNHEEREHSALFDQVVADASKMSEDNFIQLTSEALTN